ncbi:MAG: PD40 domain-containing protein [Labilithrix sp.]|nr:PD40 domain-containing protein [Labilithrix sp.]
MGTRGSGGPARVACAIGLGLTAAVAVGGAGCGGEVAAPGPALDVSTPWLLTLDSERRFELTAHRVYEGTLRQEVLDETVLEPLFPSPSGRWLVYWTLPGRDGPRMKLRRVDAAGWSEPIAVTLPGGVTPGRGEWSPTREQLLIQGFGLPSERVRTGEVVVARPRPDGSLATVTLAAGEAAGGARWAPSGDRVVVTRSDGTGRARTTVFAVADGPDLAVTGHEIVPPPGEVFEDIGSATPGARSIAQGTVSPDGRWIAFVLRREHDGSRAITAFSTTGEHSPRVLDGCVVSSALTSPGECTPYAWSGQSTLLVKRRAAGGGEELDAWTPPTGARASLGEVSPTLVETGPFGTLFVVKHEASNACSIVDLADPSAPKATRLAETELPSFRRASGSPGGRWLLLRHVDEASNEGWIDAVDLHAGPGWRSREVFRGPAELARERTRWSSDERAFAIGVPAGDSRERITRIHLATGVATTFEVDWTYGERPDVEYLPRAPWSRVGPDDRTLAIAQEGGLALWPMDRPRETAVKLDGVSASASVEWMPSR